MKTKITLLAIVLAFMGWSHSSTAQAALFKDLVPGNNQGSQPKDFITVNGTMYFITVINGSGSFIHRLWKSDGTVPGTVIVKDSIISTTVQDIIKLFNVNGTLFFTLAKNGSATTATKTELWKTDGTPGNAVLIDSLSHSAGGGSGGAPLNWTVVGDKLFWNMANANGRELWVTDGTTAGTKEVLDLWAGSSGGVEDFQMVAYNGKVYFRGITSLGNTELYSSDGTAGGTGLVKEINPSTSFSGASYPANWIVYNNELYFSADDGTNGALWKTNGTTTDTVFHGAFRSPVVFNNSIFYVNGIDLWKTNGTSADNVFVTDSANNINGATSNYLFTQYMKSLPQAPWFEMIYKITDGTTSSVVSANVGGSAVNNGGTLWTTTLNDKIYGNNIGTGLWVTDGTEGGTTQIINSVAVGVPYVFNGTVSFSNFSSAEGYELWSFTPGGSVGINETVSTTTMLNVFPNPTSGSITIGNLPLVDKNALLQIFDVNGRLVKAEKTFSNNVDVTQLNNGMYFGKVLNNTSSNYTFRFVKQ
jgi:ELWxxDGT repeat protein